MFNLRKDYEITGGTESRLDRGRMTKLVIPTGEFESLLSLNVLPFETLPFVNSHVLYAFNLALTYFMELEDEKVQLKKLYSELIYGTDMEVDRGRLASFPLGLCNMETINELEVTNA